MNEGIFLIAEEKAKQCFCSSFRDLKRQDGIFYDDFINERTSTNRGASWSMGPQRVRDDWAIEHTYISTVNFFSVIYLIASHFFFSHNWIKNLNASFCVVPSITTWNYILNSYDSMYINKFWVFHWNIQVGKKTQKGKVVTSHKKFWASVCSDKKKITLESNSSENWELSKICIEPKASRNALKTANVSPVKKRNLCAVTDLQFHIQFLICCEPLKKYKCLNKRKDRILPYKENILAKN